MAVFAKPEKQAAKIVAHALALGKARHTRESNGAIHSLGTARAYQQALKTAAEWGRVRGHRSLKDWSQSTAQKYLLSRSEEVGQKTLDLDRQALKILPQIDKLDRTKSSFDAERKLAEESRAYTPAQLAAISLAQNERNGLATELAAAAGLRAHELHTLRPVNEQPASGHREWSADRFAGIDGIRYTVTGKGGLIREVMLPVELAERLEAARFDEPVRVSDRGVHYQQHYGIAAGNSWSASFTRASQTQVGYSTGAHGVRHGYAQQRLETLQRSGRGYEDALLIISQEMGHFRPDITEVYLR